jgi:hypothetical protein
MTAQSLAARFAAFGPIVVRAEERTRTEAQMMQQLGHGHATLELLELQDRFDHG